MKTSRFALAMVAALSITLVGCGESKPKGTGPRYTYTQTLEKPVEFVLPGGDYTYGAASAKSEVSGKGTIHPKPFEHPDTWAVYMATSVYTDGSTDRSFRLVVDRQHVHALKDYLKQNGLLDKVKVIWLQYDELPPNIRSSDLSRVGWDFMPMQFRWTDMTQDIDYFVISPASRGNNRDYLRYDKWLKPYISYARNRDGEVTKAYDESHGLNDPTSKIWDKWNRHFFLVNPDGDVVDSWISIGANPRTLQVYPDDVMAAITHHLDLDPETVNYPEVNRQGHYDSEYKPSLEQQTLDIFKDIAEKIYAR